MDLKIRVIQEDSNSNLHICWLAGSFEEGMFQQFFYSEALHWIFIENLENEVLGLVRELNILRENNVLFDLHKTIFTILTSSCSQSISNGISPTSSSYVRIPMAQTSIF